VKLLDHQQSLLELTRPDGAVHVLLVTRGIHPPHVEIRRVRGGEAVARQAIARDELDRLIAALGEARRLTLGAPDGREGVREAQAAAGLRRRKGRAGGAE
jgi:hypothetical protein